MPGVKQGPYRSPVRSFQMLSVSLVAVLSLVAAGDGPRPAGRVVAGSAAANAVPPSGPGFPAFTLFGWVSPPADSTNARRMDELVAAGMTLVLPSFSDTAVEGRTADNLARLDLLAPRGLRAIVWDEGFAGLYHLDPRSPAGRALIDTVVARYAGRAEVLGWYLGDEPGAALFDLLGGVHEVLRERDPQRIAWNNLLGRQAFATRDDWLAYLREYVARVRPRVLCDDHYDFEDSGDHGQFVENAAGLAAVARESGLPFWSIVLVTPHLSYRQVTPGLLAWQAAHLLAHGARGIGFFTYWSPAPDPVTQWGDGLIARDGSLGPLYAPLAALAPRLRAAGETLAAATWLATEYAGSCPVGGTRFAADDWILAVDGRAALGQFAAADGARLVLVANSDSASAQTLALTLPHARSVEQCGATADEWSAVPGAPGDGGARVTLALAPGDFALLRIRGDFGALRAGAGPALRVWPSPARGAVRLSYQGLATGAGLEVLDAGGRRVWRARPAAGAGVVTWDGARESGGRVPPGIYFARLEDARGVAAVRIAWLGR